MKRKNIQADTVIELMVQLVLVLIMVGFYIKILFY
jgi:hypothetical protein